MSSHFFDITPPITPRTPVWPGDTPISREVVCRIEDGATVTLSALRSTVHLGAHADGSVHYMREAEGGVGVGEMPLEHFIGPCVVVDAPPSGVAGSERRVRVGDIVGGIALVTRPRVLIRTGTFPKPGVAWNEDFAGLSVELIDALADAGAITVGVDTPSVDTQNCKTLEAHKAIFRRGIAILEGLDLRAVQPGEYDLIAPPLKLMGFDGSPVRAVLRSPR